MNKFIPAFHSAFGRPICFLLSLFSFFHSINSIYFISEQQNKWEEEQWVKLLSLSLFSSILNQLLFLFSNWWNWMKRVMLNGLIASFLCFLFSLSLAVLSLFAERCGSLPPLTHSKKRARREKKNQIHSAPSTINSTLCPHQWRRQRERIELMVRLSSPSLHWIHQIIPFHSIIFFIHKPLRGPIARQQAKQTISPIRKSEMRLLLLCWMGWGYVRLLVSRHFIH